LARAPCFRATNRTELRRATVDRSCLTLSQRIFSLGKDFANPTCVQIEAAGMNSYLEGRIFNHAGRVFLVIKDNDWCGNTVRVKAIDRQRTIKEFPVATVIKHTVPASTAG
jgi:hypothetical protein